MSSRSAVLPTFPGLEPADCGGLKVRVVDVVVPKAQVAIVKCEFGENAPRDESLPVDVDGTLEPFVDDVVQDNFEDNEGQEELAASFAG